MDTVAERKVQDIRIVLVGKTGVGKSATGNTILGQKEFHQEACSKSVTRICRRGVGTVDGHQVFVVDTPGLFDTELSEAEIVQEIIKCIDLSSPGPHVFLLVTEIGRFTKEEIQALQKTQEIFGEGAQKYMMVLFTRGDDLEVAMEEYLEKGQKELKKCIEKCGGRYHVFNNKDKNNHEQVTSLLMKIQKMVEINGGDCYTNLMYKMAEEHKRKEASLRKEIESNKEEMQKKVEELQIKINSMKQNQQQTKARTRALNAQLAQMRLANTENTKEKAENQNRKTEDQEPGAEGTLQGVAYLKRKFEMEQQRQAEQALHQQRMKEAELNFQLERTQNQQRMEEEKEKFETARLEMVTYYENRVQELEQSLQQAKITKEELMKKNIGRKAKGCSIS